MKRQGSAGKKSAYDVLIIRDNGPVRRFRLNRFWIRLFLLLVFVVVVGLAGAGYVAWDSWNTLRQLTEQNVALNEELAHSRSRLDRLQNVEKMLNSYDPAKVVPLVKAPSLPQNGYEDQAIDLNTIFQDLDIQRVSIKNVQASIEPQHVALSFEINNLEENDTAKGVFSYAIITRDGRVVEVFNQGGKQDFQIRYFVRIKAKLKLPDGFDPEQLFGIQLTVNDLTGTTLFRETYSISRILV